MKLSVKQIYFYLVSFISLLVILFTATTAVSSVLTDYVFKTRPAFTYQPPLPYFGVPFLPPRVDIYPIDERMEEQASEAQEIMKTLKEEGGALKPGMLKSMDQWMIDYKRWKADQENQKKADLNALIGNIVALLIFTPVFAYHFREARKLK